MLIPFLGIKSLNYLSSEFGFIYPSVKQIFVEHIVCSSHVLCFGETTESSLVKDVNNVGRRQITGKNYKVL